MTLSILILRIGLGITFVLTGVLILKDDDKWTRMLPGWFSKYLPSAKFFMIATAIGDLILGAWLLSGYFTGIAAFLAVLHLLGVLIVSGKDEFHEVYRDIGLLFASIALAVYFLF
ncbi:MAG: DoxX family membrane protein [Minisyncoccia bacterium]